MEIRNSPHQAELVLTETQWNDVLRQMNIPSFRPGQKEVIETIMTGQDLVAVMPTGAGKSVCYQLPAYSRKALVIVICPLIALMQDQVTKLHQLGFEAACIHSDLTDSEKEAILNQASQAKDGFVLYISPERLQHQNFQSWLLKQNPLLFAVDEAHCISQWRHDFREEYGDLHYIRESLPQIPILALTASATPQVIRDIQKSLRLRKNIPYVRSFHRSNLFLQAFPCENLKEKWTLLMAALNKHRRQQVLIYCSTRKSCEDLCRNLILSGYKTGFYHAGLLPLERRRTQEMFRDKKIQILVATNAFGMGIDLPDIRLVVHWQMPNSIDSLYQEMGRAGRDGEKAICLLLYSKQDRGLQGFFIVKSEAKSAVKKNRWKQLEEICNYSESKKCRHRFILSHYADSNLKNLSKNCGRCDNCNPETDEAIPRPEPCEPYRSHQIPLYLDED